MGGGGLAGGGGHGLVRDCGCGLRGLGGIGVRLDGGLGGIEALLRGAGGAGGGLGVNGGGLECGLSFALGLVLHGGGVAFLGAEGGGCGFVRYGNCGFEFGG